uniref:hypothetical protein n=1 Tax=Candidatus Electrothrix sp. TaxID=2170559 RepID=UPI004055E076
MTTPRGGGFLQRNKAELETVPKPELGEPVKMFFDDAPLSGEKHIQSAGKMQGKAGSGGKWIYNMFTIYFLINTSFIR